MHRSPGWLTAAFVVSLSVACSARGGGGNIGPLDSGSTDDARGSRLDNGATDDATVGIDRVDPPTDDGVAPFDSGKPTRDTGTVIDVGTPPVCGDARCNGTENCMTCRDDCGPCAASCGDGACGTGESCTSCPTDCGTCPAVCGDGACNGPETCTSCSRDCGVCPPRCGDGMCNGSDTCTSCPADCGACPANCAAIGSCAACATNPACGWCTFDGACQAGNASGPTATSTCSVFGGWVRNATSCSAAVDAGPRDTGLTDSGGSTNIAQTCTSASQGLQAQCGWRFARAITCAPGSSVLVGCTGGADAGTASCGTRIGSCTGDPMMRVCPGAGQCTTGLAVTGTGNADDDGCGLCPLGRFSCPAAGSVTVYERAYNNTTGATCTISTGL
jgi:hypothetical protein